MEHFADIEILGMICESIGVSMADASSGIRKSPRVKMESVM